MTEKEIDKIIKQMDKGNLEKFNALSATDQVAVLDRRSKQLAEKLIEQNKQLIDKIKK